MLRFIAILVTSVCLSVAVFAADARTKSDTAEVRKAKEQFAAQQESKKKSARIQKKWAKSQKKAYTKAAKAGRKSPSRRNVNAANTRAVNR